MNEEVETKCSSIKASIEDKRILLRLKALDNPALRTSKSIIKSSHKKADSYLDKEESEIRILYSSDGANSWKELADRIYQEKNIFIVTTIYEDTSFFGETLDSIFGQECPSCGIVYLIKDASKSNVCHNFIQEYLAEKEIESCRITIAYLSKPDSGMYEGLQTAFELIKRIQPADSSIMTYINADDRLMPWSTRIADNLITRSGIHWLTGSTNVIDESGDTIFSHKVLFNVDEIRAGLNLGRVLPFIQQEGTFWTFFLYSRCKGINSALKLAGDFDLWRQFAAIETLVTVDKCLGAFRKRAGQKSGDIKSYYKEACLVLEATQGQHKVVESTITHVYERRPIGGLLAKLDQNNSIGYYSRNDEGFPVPAFEEQYDPLYSYPVEICQIETRYKKCAVLTSESRENNSRASTGLERLGISPNPSNYSYYYQISEGQNYGYTLRMVGHEGSLAILRLRVAASDCGEGSVLSVRINGKTRELGIKPSDFRLKRFNAFVDYVLLENNPGSFEVEIFQQGSNELYVSFNHYCTPLPKNFGNYSHLKRSLNGWPYLANHYKIQFDENDADKMPKISVIVPTYNQAETLRDTLASIVSQFYPRLQLIVLDGHSSDETRNILADFLHCIDSIHIAIDKGQADAISKGIELANGDIITWLNSDDLYAPFCLNRIALAYVRKRTDVLVGDCMVFRGNDFKFIHSPQVWGERIEFDELLDIKGKWLKGKYFHQPECFFTRRAIEIATSTTGLKFINDELYYSMDYDIWAKLAWSNCTFQRINSIVAIYRLTEQQKTSSVDKYLPELLEHSSYLAKKLKGSSVIINAANKKEKKSFKDIRVLLFNDNGFFGGAGIAHKRLAKSLMVYGIDVKCVACASKYSEAGHSVKIEEIASILDDYGPDLVICGNIHGLASEHEEVFRVLSNKQPCWFMVHDFWITSGRDPYPSLDPTNPINGKSGTDSEWISRINQIKDLHILPNSNYTYKSLSDVGFYNLIDPLGFTLGFEEETSCLSAQGIMDYFETASPLRILIGSVGLSEIRKGAFLMLDALKYIPRKALELIAISTYGLSRIEAISQYCLYTHHGFIKQKDMMNLLDTHDVYVSMSTIETFGQSPVEALRAGRPLIIVDNGGSNEYVENTINSIVIKNDPRELADAITRMALNKYSDGTLLKGRVAKAISLNADRFSLATQGYSMLRLMDSLLKWRLPTGGQRVTCEEPADEDIDLNYL